MSHEHKWENEGANRVICSERGCSETPQSTIATLTAERDKVLAAKDAEIAELRRLLVRRTEVADEVERGKVAAEMLAQQSKTIATLTAELDALQLEIARLTDTGVRADERREMQKAVAEALAAEMGAETLRAALRRIRTRHAVIDGQFDRSTVSEIDEALGGKP